MILSASVLLKVNEIASFENDSIPESAKIEISRELCKSELQL
jgi:hypothetical protein